MNMTTHRERKLPRAPGLILCLAAGVLLLLGCGAEEPTAAPLPSLPSLPLPDSSGGISCRTPVGVGADFLEFVWEYELPEGGFFEVVVFDYNGAHKVLAKGEGHNPPEIV
jgi:hypothetical protein